MLLRLCRLFALPVEEHEVQPDKHERNTEPLPHVERHRAFEVHLVFFQEFDEEAEDEYLRQTEAEEEAPVQLGSVVVLLVQVYHPQEEDEVCDGFVELGGMPGYHVHPFEDERPGHVGGLADDFRVHQVGKADAAGGDGGGDGNHVQHVHVVHLRLAAVEPKGDNQSQRTAVTGKAFVSCPLPSAAGQRLEGQNHFPEMVQVIVRLVEQAVSQSCSNQYAEEAVEEQRFERLFGDFTVAVLAVHYYISQYEAYEP